MPTINEIKSSTIHKKFEKISHRPWDEEGKQTEQNNESISIKKINPKLIKKWAFKDRYQEDIGDISALAKEFKEIGQQQPCIVRAINDEQYTHELIAGERRWLAALEAKIDLLVIEKNISDTEAALIQIAENESREDLSDYAKGMSLSKLIDQGLIKQKDIIEKLNKSKQYVSALLSFPKIPSEIMATIKHPQNISAGTAAKIKQLSQRGEEYKNAIISLADRISDGKLGWEKLESLVTNLINKDMASKRKASLEKIIIKGKHIISIKVSANGIEAIHIQKDIMELMNKASLDNMKIGEAIGELIMSKIN